MGQVFINGRKWVACVQCHLQFLKTILMGECTFSISLHRHSRQNIAYTIPSAAPNLVFSCHSFEAAVHRDARLSKVTWWSTMNSDTCNVPKSSPKFLFFAKNVLPECTHSEYFTNLVMSRGGAIVPCFWWWVAGRNHQKQHKDCIFIN